MGRSRAHAITSRADFQNIFRHGQTLKAAHLVAHVIPGDPGQPGRMAVVVSRKQGGAVQRNRIRRRIKEIVRRRGGPPDGTDVVFVAKQGVERLKFGEVEQEVDDLLEGVTTRMDQRQ